MPQVAWSYSNLNLFESCSRKYHHLRVLKNVKEVEGPELKDGQRIHKAFEKYMLDVPLPADLEHHEPALARLKALKGERLLEAKMALTADFQPTTFFAKDVWFRGVIDFAVVNGSTAVAIDYKTGKVKDDHDQLSLFAGALFAHYPDLQSVRTAYLWVTTGELTAKTFEREQAIWPNFMPRVRRIEIAHEENKWVPRPSGLCRGYCPVRACEHWEPKRDR